MPRLLHITARCSDSFNATLSVEGKVVSEYEGYVPSGIGIGGGDDIEMTIDLDTGQIQDWEAPSELAVEAVLGEDEDGPMIDDDGDDEDGDGDDN